MNVFYKLKNNKAQIYVVERDVLTIDTFEPYFYVDARHEADVNAYNVIVEPTNVVGFPDGNRLVKVITQKPSDVAKIREQLENQGIQTYEADIPFANRFLIDMTDFYDIGDDNIKNIIYLDIEVLLPESGFPYPERADMPVICITCYNTKIKRYTTFTWGSIDNHDAVININNHDVKIKRVTEGEHTVFCCDTEKEMFEVFLEYLRDIKPAIIAGWNVRGFDMLYLYNRMNKIGLDGDRLSFCGGYVVTGDRYKEGIDIKGVWLYDLLKAYMNFKNMRYYPSLAHAAETEGFEGKLDIDINDAWENDKDKLIMYNKRDVELCVRINEKYRLIDADLMWHTLKLSRGIQLDDAGVSNKLADFIILRRARKHKMALPSKREHKVKSIEGAVVYAEPGLYENVAVFDFKSMYPNIVRFFNIGLDTKLTCEKCGEKCEDDTCKVILRGEAIEVNGVKFLNTRRAFIIDIIDELLDIRQQYKNKMKEILDKHGKKTEEYKILDRQQTLLKFFINAFSYGVLLYRRFRLTDTDIYRKYNNIPGA